MPILGITQPTHLARGAVAMWSAALDRGLGAAAHWAGEGGSEVKDGRLSPALSLSRVNPLRGRLDCCVGPLEAGLTKVKEGRVFQRNPKE